MILWYHDSYIPAWWTIWVGQLMGHDGWSFAARGPFCLRVEFLEPVFMCAWMWAAVCACMFAEQSLWGFLLLASSRILGQMMKPAPATFKGQFPQPLAGFEPPKCLHAPWDLTQKLMTKVLLQCHGLSHSYVFDVLITLEASQHAQSFINPHCCHMPV